MGNCPSTCCAQTPKVDPQFLRGWGKAVAEGNFDLVQMLHYQSPDIAYVAIGRSGDTALHIAASKGFQKIVEYLLVVAKVDIDVISQRTGNTALHEAAKANQLDMIRLLIAYGADIGIRNKEKKKPREVCKSSLKIYLDAHKARKIRELGPPPSLLPRNTSNGIQLASINLNVNTDTKIPFVPPQTLEEDEYKIIGDFFLTLRDSKRQALWTKIMKTKEAMKKESDIHRMLQMLIAMKLQKEPKSPVGRLKFKEIEHMRKRIRGKYTVKHTFAISKEEFVNYFGSRLLEISREIEDEKIS